MTNEVIYYCILESIILAGFTSYNTRVFQSLDVSFFRPLEESYSREPTQKFKETQAVVLAKNDILRIYQGARRRTATEFNIATSYLQKLEKKAVQLDITLPEILVCTSSGVQLCPYATTLYIDTTFHEICNKYRRGIGSAAGIEELRTSTLIRAVKADSFHIQNDRLVNQRDELKERKNGSKKQDVKAQIFRPKVLEKREDRNKQQKIKEQEHDDEAAFFTT
ncbi:hypothetical protein N7G274_010164 [Stereocaulon virgatum]|uniref:Uncharacterized protein n=1 Tax=Stereocaulon virgatum TaxID=373712 RepID=A0ABR3ZY83_9LECA